MAIIGIDLGTTNSLACIWWRGRAELIPNALGSCLTPSAVSLDGDGALLVGAAARERLVSHPEVTAASFKRWMGTERSVSLGDRTFRPEELSALILRQLREDAEAYLGEAVEEAVVTVPAYFDDNQRSATKLAAELAGLPVKRLINEPSAAALYSRLKGASAEDARLLVVDFGGGTLDVSLVDCFENVVEIVSIAGDNRLGGDDVDLLVAEHFCAVNGYTLAELPPERRGAVLRQAELAKRALSERLQAVMVLTTEERSDVLTLTRPLLRRLCEPLFERVRAVLGRALRDGGAAARELDDVILVGGSARLTVLGDFLEEYLGRRPLPVPEPETAVALGAGVCAGIKERREDLRDLVMTDVCPFSLGVGSYENQRDENPHMVVLIERSSLLPASRTDTFYTLFDGQQRLRLDVYQGESYYVSENLKLGEVTVQVPPGPAGSQHVRLRFSYDINGILQVEAEGSGGDRREAVIVNPRLHLSPGELETRLRLLEEVKLAASGAQADRLLLARGERLFSECVGPRRERAGRVLAAFRRALEEGGAIALRKARTWTEEQLQGLEAGLEADREPGPWGEDL